MALTIDQLKGITFTKALKERFLEALRGGKYLQGDGALKISGVEGGPPLYCCLGVLADLIDPEGWQKDPVITAITGRKVHTPIYTWGPRPYNKSFLTIDEGSAIVLSQPTQDRLAEKNDNGESFHEIASWIELNVSTEEDKVEDDAKDARHAIEDRWGSAANAPWGPGE